MYITLLGVPGEDERTPAHDDVVATVFFGDVASCHTMIAWSLQDLAIAPRFWIQEHN